MTRLRVAKDADDQIRAIETWWSEHRPAAPLLFVRELADALDMLVAAPTIGVAYRHAAVGRTIRRVLLRQSRYHVYFSYDAEADVVEVRAVWHAQRGSGPPLR